MNTNVVFSDLQRSASKCSRGARFHSFAKDETLVHRISKRLLIFKCCCHQQIVYFDKHHCLKTTGFRVQNVQARLQQCATKTKRLEVVGECLVPPHWCVVQTINGFDCFEKCLLVWIQPFAGCDIQDACLSFEFVRLTESILAVSYRQFQFERLGNDQEQIHGQCCRSGSKDLQCSA